VPDEQLLVGEALPLVNGSSLLLVGREDGLVGAELSDCVSAFVFADRHDMKQEDRNRIREIAIPLAGKISTQVN